MYRATAEAVSGTRVYADGKWLRCIGNKRVSVGDRIWTDGHCVYGHEQESEQPKVITAPEDEGIPILIDQTLQIDDYLANQKSYYVYDSRLKTLKPPDSLGFTGTEMINDSKRNAYLISYNDASTFYATNIDKKGNKYKLIGTSTKITIYKNEEEVSTTDLNPLIEQQCKKAIASIPSGGNVTRPPGSNYDVFGKFAVIENENDWNALLFIYAVGKQSIISDVYDVSYKRITSELFGGPSETTIHATRYTSGAKGFLSMSTHFVNQDGYSLISRCSCTYYDLPEEYYDVYDRHNALIDYWTYSRTVHIQGKQSYSASLLPISTGVKFHLQDGFYFTIDDYPNFPTNMFCYPIFMTISIYTKKNALLLTETFRTRSRITIGKIKSRYLIAVRHTKRFGIQILDINDELRWYSSSTTNKDESEIFDNDRYNAYATETPYVDEGLYIYDGKTLNKIADGTCLNARFRAMPQHKNWQKRIQKL